MVRRTFEFNESRRDMARHVTMTQLCKPIVLFKQHGKANVVARISECMGCALVTDDRDSTSGSNVAIRFSCCFPDCLGITDKHFPELNVDEIDKHSQCGDSKLMTFLIVEENRQTNPTDRAMQSFLAHFCKPRS